jgi:hypothetical protein
MTTSLIISQYFILEQQEKDQTNILRTGLVELAF